MPYILPHKRKRLDRYLDSVQPDTVGELNYCFTKLALAYVEQMGDNYGAINAVIGALECSKLEFYRRLAAPYEDRKIIENGDVYPPTKEV